MLVRLHDLQTCVIVKIKSTYCVITESFLGPDGIITSYIGVPCIIKYDKITHLDKMTSVQSYIMDKFRIG